MPSETLHLTESETATVVAASADRLVVEATYGPGGSPPPAHFHPAQDERFTLVSGALRVKVDSEERVLAAGDVLDVPRGTVHQMWNPHDGAAVVRWETTPAGRTLDWFRAIDAARREAGGTPGPLHFGVLLREYGDVFRLAVGPAVVGRGATAVLGTLGRARGHSA